jgi:hypothetical protein
MAMASHLLEDPPRRTRTITTLGGMATTPTTGGLRITNATEGEVVPPPSPAARTSRRTHINQSRQYQQPGMEPQPRFVRHADAGRWNVPAGGGGAGHEVIDLPPMYTEIVPDGVDAVATTPTTMTTSSGPVSPVREREDERRTGTGT